MFGEDDETRSVLIKPMNHTGASFIADAANIWRMGQDCLNQRPCFVAHGRMDDNARLLVDDQEILIFINNVYWDRFRL